MTIQIPDHITVENKEYRIIGIKGSRLLTAQDFGVSPSAVVDYCWRGFFVDYAILDKRLLATRLTVMGQVEDYVDYVAPRPLNNCEDESCATVWNGLQRPTPFTGNLLIGRSVLPKLYSRKGFQKPLAFRQVLELDFKDGQLLNIADISQYMTLQRNIINHATLAQQPIMQPDQSQETWQQYKFSLNYDAWWKN